LTQLASHLLIVDDSCQQADPFALLPDELRQPAQRVTPQHRAAATAAL
jgi:hypothetical protein